jgi:hypothetical protein
MARRRKHSHQPRKRAKLQPGILAQPKTPRELVIPALIDLLKMYLMIGMWLISFVLLTINFIPALLWGVFKGTSTLAILLYGSVSLYFLWLAYKPTDELFKLSQSTPLEYIDFRYVAPRRNRMMLFGTLATILFLLPVFYIHGVINAAIWAVHRYVTHNQLGAKTLAWIGTAAITGILGNLATMLIVKIAVAIYRFKGRRNDHQSYGPSLPS